MKKYLESKKYLVIQKNLGLFVAESHYFDAKGKRQLTLTNKKDLAELMTLTEANTFISSEKNPRDYEIVEAEETEYEDEEEYDEEEN